ncbi:hypothetical protein ISN44_As01g052380 [Arabidopsis suecica]|uniref:Transmembrane protein n=2 Tax=Arabidopsis TaxID=3701 RepID=B3H4T7_ARATH|nr:uncharacterized protein AT1G63057 [Arabidopsis thaliana]AEE34047.1 transmembrane protein [Arabidopsis thaliana]KAG7658245.1 hypothetical protein ISN44_As01g052380 [Arabidopsis suecica]|eukprot:NP_001117540.1 transmembrane protein [Arabidopsis thaliana]
MMNTKIVALLMVVMMVTMGMENILVQARHHHHHHHHSPSPSPSSDFDDSGSKSPSPSPKSKEKSSTYCMIGCSFEKCFHHGKSSTMTTGDVEKYDSCMKKCSKICNKKNENEDIYV